MMPRRDTPEAILLSLSTFAAPLTMLAADHRLTMPCLKDRLAMIQDRFQVDLIFGKDAQGRESVRIPRMQWERAEAIASTIWDKAHTEAA